MTHTEGREGFAPCPTCKQYSHSIGDDALADAFNHFQSMYAHPLRGHPMGHWFDEKTREAAQVLMAAARTQAEGGLNLTISEKLKLDIGTAMMEERNTGLDDYAGAFNHGISAARVAAFKIIDRTTPGLHGDMGE